MEKILIDLNTVESIDQLAPEIQMSVGRFSGAGGTSFAKVYLNMRGEEDGDGLFVKLNGLRMADDKQIDYNNNWKKISMPLCFRAAGWKQYEVLDELQDHLNAAIRNLGPEYAHVECKGLFKSYENKLYNKLYIKWPALVDDLGLLVGKKLACTVDGVEGEVNAVEFGQMVLPATVDMYALLKLWVSKDETGSIKAGLYLEPKLLECKRDPFLVPQSKIPPGTPLPPKEVFKPHPYGKSK
jgi:hypothetical protein